MLTPAPTVGLYVHLPWCVRKCPYCDFNSHEVRAPLRESLYVAALMRDLETDLAAWGRAVDIATIFIGGGTPSLFSGAAIARLLEGIAERCSLVSDIEITLEANPGTAEAARLRDYVAAGVNRLSLGVQSFQDAKLASLGRIHDGGEALRAVGFARAAGCSNLNLDLMFGLPGDAPGDALRDLEQAVACAPEHISWYQLTIEEGTAFSRQRPLLPDHDQICDDYDAGLRLLADAGYEHYEISAHARPGRAARHNLNYWDFGDYLGIGAGAHGKRTLAGGIVRTAKIRHPERYLKAALDGAAMDDETAVAGPTLATEFMINGLRLRAGFTLEAFTARTGLPVDDIAAGLDEAQERGWLVRCGSRLRPTTQGFRFLNELQLLFTGPAL